MRRHRPLHHMQTDARRRSAKKWIAKIASQPDGWVGAKVNIKKYVKRYGVDKYTGYDDLMALGFQLEPKDEQWSVRPPNTPKQKKPDPDEDMWWVDWDGRRMFVVGYTEGVAPYGVYEDEMTGS